AADIDGEMLGKWLTRSYPSLGAITRAFPDRRFAGTRLTYRMRLRAPASAEPHRLVMIADPPRPVWQIARVEGVAAEGELSARGVRVVPREGLVGGRIELSIVWPRDADAFDRWLPSFVELAPGDAAIEPLLRRAGAQVRNGPREVGVLDDRHR